MTHICVGKLTIIGSDNGLLPGRRQAIICTNAGILRTNFNEILIEIYTIWKMAAILSRPQCVKDHFSGIGAVMQIWGGG